MNNHKKGNLLIVDDEELITESVKLMMEEHADEIYVAFSAKDALEIAQNKKLHCIISDINMPQMTGVDLIKEVRAFDQEIPFIFYTAYGSNSLMMEAVKYGAFDFLDKPNLDGLVEVVTKGLEQGVHGINVEESGEHFVSDFQKLLQQVDTDK